ncbi:LodA/GoxA family CTQ-dependent oxidase [Bradyrhizobium sp. CCGE-LA001]|uniref:LodA/GoxA family CTQ-dependent oxidase n=1 Tax=Bradyrhizobium sp. CCGE-LA001 TaxID=1223566 RepID=UPI0002AAB616|nr:LodA/GoxA family CTQ-dependent oxidase [Bradyrhizobium sp. CCGE-LA001]AMA60160.1 hypothetical protein BCCGELA001_30645 [Bradyrhizobium sp. CCGE-LA001]
MAFPDDLTGVAAFKIHPAIGCARLASNKDYYEFFEQEKKREADPQSVKYMSLRDGKHWIMRQAVRFRIFAYDNQGREIGELTGDIMTRLGLRATWTANVANRKLNVWSQGATPAVEAQASATAGESKRLEGDNPWRPGKVWLGDITGDGLFIPPMGGAYRKTADTSIPPYGAHRNDNGILDTTSDGSINVSLAGAGNIPIVPACVIVAPQDHSPDVGPGQIDNLQNKDFVKQTRTLLNIPQNASLTGVGYAMDIAMMKTMNADYNPGMEICLDGGPALRNPASAFFPRGQQYIDDNEIRPSYATAKPGQLTAGLCSAWQTDLSACLNYWTSTYPNHVSFPDTEPETRVLARKQFAAAGPRINNPDWLNANIDMMEIARDVENDINFLHGTERDANDTAGDEPVAPFPVEAVQLPPGA